MLARIMLGAFLLSCSTGIVGCAVHHQDSTTAAETQSTTKPIEPRPVTDHVFKAALVKLVRKVEEADGVFVPDVVQFSVGAGYMTTIYVQHPGERFAPMPDRVAEDFAAAIASAAASAGLPRNQVLVRVQELTPVEGFRRDVGTAVLLNGESSPTWHYAPQ